MPLFLQIHIAEGSVTVSKFFHNLEVIFDVFFFFLVKRKGLFKMPAFWDDGRLMSKGHLTVPRMSRRFYRYTRRTKELARQVQV